MSVQFGNWNFEGRPLGPDCIERVKATLTPFGPDGTGSYCNGGVDIVHRAFHTTKEAHRETQPHVLSSRAVITWDGRLDNRTDLVADLRDSSTTLSTDVAIVGAAYDKWGTGCFAKLVGNWALSIWNPINHSLILAIDPIGTHHLYYSIDRDNATWSTVLEPLVLLAGKAFQLCEEYLAGWLAMRYPDTHLTPYSGIQAVSPSSYVVLCSGSRVVCEYWDFDPTKTIRYHTDGEYEEHFRIVFATAVQRSLRSDRPLLAELSGGIDSSSIVCMADTIISRDSAKTPRLDSLSWYDDSDLDERPYFARVEEKRGRVGYHINLGGQKETSVQELFRSGFERTRFAATPIPRNSDSGLFAQYSSYVRLQKYRVTLSGIGGEEATGGGVPTPTPELQDLLARARFFTLAKQLNAWAAKMRRSRLAILWEALQGFLFCSPLHVPQNLHPIPWLDSGFTRGNYKALQCYPSKLKMMGALPSFQRHIRELNHVRRFLAYTQLDPDLLREIRYPFLDRSLLEFTYAIPQEQLVHVGERRSLMKRALAGIVPNELLSRKRKRVRRQNPKRGNSIVWPTIPEIGQRVLASCLGITNQDQVLRALQQARCGEQVPIGSLSRILMLESWLRHLMNHGVLQSVQSGHTNGNSRRSFA